MGTHVVFPTLAEAVAFVAIVDRAFGYPNAATLTETWDKPRKHPSRDEWAVAVDERVLALTTEQARARLTYDASTDPRAIEWERLAEEAALRGEPDPPPEEPKPSEPPVDPLLEALGLLPEKPAALDAPTGKGGKVLGLEIAVDVTPAPRVGPILAIEEHDALVAKVGEAVALAEDWTPATPLKGTK